MATNPILGRDVYLALAAVGWADGQLTTEAADAIVRTALEEGLSFEDVAAIEEATKAPTPVGDVDRMNMSKADRLYVYAVASWIAALDGNVSEKEHEALGQLALVLGVPETPRAHADAIMRQIAEQTDRPERFDLLALRQTLDTRLEAARKLRLAQQDQELLAGGAGGDGNGEPHGDEAPKSKSKGKAKGKAKHKAKSSSS